MRIYQPKRKDENGKNVKYQLWYADFQDHQDIRRRIPLHTNKNTAFDWSKFIEQLAIAKSRNLPLDDDVSQWLEVIPKALKVKLISFELLDSQEVRQGEPLAKHLEDWKAALVNGGGSVMYSEQQYQKVAHHFNNCKFNYISDISASRLLSSISDSKRTVKARNKATKKLYDKIISQVGQTTKNSHLKACKQFCRWLCQDGRTSTNPLEHLKSSKAISEKRAALEPEELRELLNYCKAAGTIYKLTGYQRYVLYLFAAQTGFRAAEIASLRVSDFDLDGLTVTLSGEHTKNKKDAAIPLRPDTAAELKTYLAGKMQNVQAFKLPYIKNLAEMLRKDLTSAGIETEGRGLVDFHGLRHTFGTHLAAAGVHPKTAMTLMRHSNINLTMSRYTHTLRGQENIAINSLPDITKAPESQSQVKTGTDNSCVDSSVDKLNQNRGNLAVFDRPMISDVEKAIPVFSSGKQAFTDKNSDVSDEIKNGHSRIRSQGPFLFILDNIGHSGLLFPF